MKILILKDRLIDEPDWNIVQEWLTDWWEKHANITPTFFIEEKDYSYYPTYVDSNNYRRPKASWLKDITADVYKRYSGEGTDHVVTLIHESNWKSAKIWGTNWSNIYDGYQLHYCRWDGTGSNRLINSFGTLWHEIHHSLDALVKTYTGYDVNSLLSVKDWDDDITHGGKLPWEYIRYQENPNSMYAIQDLLKEAYAKRQAIYDQKTGTMKKTVSLLEQIIILIRKLNNQKHTMKL